MSKKKKAKKEKSLGMEETFREETKIAPFLAYLEDERIVSQLQEAKDLYAQSRFGEPVGDKIQYALVEGGYLSSEDYD